MKDLVLNSNVPSILLEENLSVPELIYFWNFDIIVDACEAYARRWTKKGDVKFDTLSHFLSGFSRSVICKNAESEDFKNVLSTPDTSPFSMILVLSESWVVYDAVSVSKLLILAIAEFEFSHRWIILAIAKFDFSDGWIILAIAEFVFSYG